MIDHDLKDVKLLYAKMGVQKVWSGERRIFDTVEFRYVLRDKFDRAMAIVEAKKLAVFKYRLNFLYLSLKEKNIQTTQKLINQVIQELKPKILFISIHIADTLSWDICKKLNYQLITDRVILMQNKLLLDGVHLSFIKKM